MLVSQIKLVAVDTAHEEAIRGNTNEPNGERAIFRGTARSRRSHRAQFVNVPTKDAGEGFAIDHRLASLSAAPSS